MSELRVPKRHVQVVLSLATGPVEAEVFLSDYAKVHGGSETIADLLESQEPFFPARTGAQMRFIARDSVRWARVPFEAVEANAAGPGAQEFSVRVTLQDGSELKGRARYVAPAGKARLLDYLNADGRYFLLHEEKASVLVRRSFVTSVSLEEEVP